MKPILFSTAMVQAILEGRKIMTRRIIKPQPDPDSEPSIAPRILGMEDNLGKWFWDTPEGERIYKDCPFGKVGDILWVRESWRLAGWDFEEPEMRINYKTGETEICEVHDPKEDCDWLINQVEQLEAKGVIDKDTENDEKFIFTGEPNPWKPSIHMPKEACRLFLKIKSINVERLQDITKEDAIAEGIGRWVEERLKSKPVHYQLYYTEPGDDSMYSSCPILSFESLWQSINGPDSWDENPWVWVVEFECTEKPDNFLKKIR